MPRPSAWLRAAWAKAVLNTVTVGMPRRSSSTASATLTEVEVPQSPKHFHPAEVIVGRKVAVARPRDAVDPAWEVGGDARQKEPRVGLAVSEKEEALVCEVAKPRRRGDGKGKSAGGGRGEVGSRGTD